jgi:hypothetical protein
MSLLFISFFGFVALLLGLFLWAIRKPRHTHRKPEISDFFEDAGKPHISSLPQIRQALSAADNAYLESKGGGKLAKRVQRERKTVVLAYLTALQDDFERLLQQAKLVAALSPEVVAMHEFERMRLSLEFSLRCTTIRARILFGAPPVVQLSGLSDVVSGLTVRIESAMRGLAERAAAATEIPSPLDHRSIDSI